MVDAIPHILLMILMALIGVAVPLATFAILDCVADWVRKKRAR